MGFLYLPSVICAYLKVSLKFGGKKKSTQSSAREEQQTNWVTFTFIYTDEEYVTACWFFASRPSMEPFWAHSTLPSLTNLSSAHQTHACAALHKDLSVFPSEASALLSVPALWPRSTLSFPECSPCPSLVPLSVPWEPE